MRKIVLMMSVSLDGYMEGPDRQIDWHQVDEELHQHMNDTLRPMGGFLDGRVTHELMAAYWPTADARPDAAPVEAEFAEIWRAKPKIVFSRTLKPGPADWHTTVLPEVVPAAIRALKEEPGGDLALGGADLAATFLEHDLVDEFRTYIHPVRIGAGRRHLPTTSFAPRPLRLVESRTFGNGVVLLRHERTGT
ncbi:dihydrofolate reductase family protein [Streptomyces sp. VRA16 Mangrove soil]|uniref:dihydrofolate reductase family protein n=1 Tax=Streptomyces sp. VRA16 Mangrove soil TaxID=2817434 RepID=UPI001A9FF572|nr:dihydrofolate reductase family protein [Streptomyces sp. VRA16 Mangrove soil]MBO1332995.1 dihydrofolate reductase family protein [Streptomyces sp. VRA16 Mangrove soil]